MTRFGSISSEFDLILFLNRYDAEANTARQEADATLIIERYVTVQADGHGEKTAAQGNTPSEGNKLVRKIWHKATAFEDSDVTTWTLAHTFADDTAYIDTIDTFQELLVAATYGSIPLTLAQTWQSVPAYEGLLDIVPGAAVALSAARLLRSDYTGDAIRVRRASDNTEQDIGFDGDGLLDESALATFCAGTDGFIRTWYDQSGNGNDATQAATASQPKVYDSVTGVDLENAKPSLAFDGVNDVLIAASSVTVGLNHTLVIVGKGLATATDDVFSVDRFEARIQSNSYALLYDGEPSQYYFTPSTSNQFSFFGGRKSADDLTYASINGGLQLSSTAKTSDLWGTTTRQPTIGARNLGSLGLFWEGKVQEVILYLTDQSANRFAIEANINANYLIYDQSPTGLLATYPGAAAAYSLRQLISTARLAIAVRRDSDDAVLGIGFVNGELDTTTLASFCSGTNGYVSVWFDQSGNGNDARMLATSLQPKIYDSVTGVVTENGKAAVEGILSGSYLNLNSPIIGESDYSIYTAHSFESSKMLFGGTSPTIGLWDISGGLYQRFDNNTNFSLSGSFVTGDRVLSYQNRVSGSLEIAANGQASTTGTNTATFTINVLLAGFGIGYRYTGRAQEFIFYDSDQSANRAGIETNINAFYSIY